LECNSLNKQNCHRMFADMDADHFCCLSFLGTAILYSCIQCSIFSVHWNPHKGNGVCSGLNPGFLSFYILRLCDGVFLPLILLAWHYGQDYACLCLCYCLFIFAFWKYFKKKLKFFYLIFFFKLLYFFISRCVNIKNKF